MGSGIFSPDDCAARIRTGDRTVTHSRLMPLGYDNTYLCLFSEFVAIIIICHYTMDSATIKVRNLPPQISCEDKEGFLKYFGAKYVKILTSKTNRSIAYARFESKEFAEAVIQRLHQKELFGHRLTVELSPNDLDVNLMKCPKPLPEIECNADEVKKLQEAYLKKLNSWTTAIDLNQPPPYHLRYSYPDPNPHILSNIANALACNPKFYYQVLHLMNRMNLPAPFDSVDGNTLKNFMKIETADKYTTTVDTDPELSESEMESEGESEHIDLVESKLSSTRRTFSKSMIPKRLKVVTGIVKKKRKVELANVFDTVECEVPKKIEVKVSAELKPSEGPTVNTEGGFGVIYSTKCVTNEEIKKDSESDEDDVTGDSISKEELATNRLSDNDMKNMPIFKNYYPGAPSCRLYVKNLAKTVSDTDLKYIYKRFIKSGDIQPGTMFDIRLMQEGRMKGQAFITLPSVENAQQALKETNGYILKDKPMIVQFARSATAK